MGAGRVVAVAMTIAAFGAGGLVADAAGMWGGGRTATVPLVNAPSTPKPVTTPSAIPQPKPPVVKPIAKPPVLVKVPAKAKPKPPAVMRQEDRTLRVRNLEARLAQLGMMAKKWVDGYYGEQTATAVDTFQRKHELDRLGYVDEATWTKLKAKTRTPTKAELYPPKPKTTNTPGALDERCLTGRVICMDKTSRTLRWVVDGKVELTMDVRFGCKRSATREGTFHIRAKVRHGYSKIYDSDMPFSMFFSGNQAVHYSSDFAKHGYDGCSHGCANIRDWDRLEKLFQAAKVGDKVVVYRT